MGADAGVDDRRIVIVGVAGSGKTTLSIRMADRLGMPVFHLDQVAAADGDGDPRHPHTPTDELPATEFEPRPLEHRREIAGRIAAESRWIAEGSFLDWTDPLLDRADTIVWLDHVGPIGASRRVLSRVRRSQQRESGQRSGVERFIRPRSYVRHAVGLVRELWDVTGYFWRDHAPRVAEDIAARRWDRITRSAISVALEPHSPKVVHVRDRQILERFERHLGLTSIDDRDAQPAIDA